MDTNKHRKKIEGYRQGYLRSALSDQEVGDFLNKHNKRGIKTCLTCKKTFKSEGSHNRICKKCKAKQKLKEKNRDDFDIPVHHMSGKFKTCHHFRGEVE